MKQTLVVFRGALRRIKFLVVLSLLAGVLLCVLMHLISGQGSSHYSALSIGLLDMDGSPASQDLALYLREDLGMALETDADQQYMETRLLEKHISALVTVPPGYQQSLLAKDGLAPVEITVMDDYANAAFVQAYVQSYVGSAASLALAANGSGPALAALLAEARQNTPALHTVAADPARQQAETETEAFNYTIGFYQMIGFLLVIGFSVMLQDDRRGGMYQRIKVSSVGTLSYICGTCLSGFVLFSVMLVPFFSYAAISGFTTGVVLWQAAIPCLLFALVLVGAGLVLGLYMPTRNSLTAAVMGIATITCMLGGSYFPLSMVPDIMQKFARATPQFWALESIAMLRSGGSIALPLVVLCLFAALLFLVAGIRFADAGKTTGR